MEGHRWDSDEAAHLTAEHGRDGARLVHDESTRRLDILILLIATDGAVARLGHDIRRLRPNIVLSDVAAAVELEPLGRALQLSGAVIGVYSVRQRCIVTTMDPDSGAQYLFVLRRIRDEFDGEIALNCWVIEPGIINVGGWMVGRPYPIHL